MEFLDEAHDDAQATVAAAFSPDGRRLAYTVRSDTDTPALFILDLAGDRARLIHESRCDRYSALRVCTYLSDPVWAGDEAVAFTLNDGGLPVVFESGSAEDPRSPSRLNVITPQGRTILTLAEPDVYVPRSCHRIGDTIFFNRLADEGFWLDASELARGVYQPHALPIGALISLASPDGRYIVWPGLPGRPWRLLEVRTGQETPLGTSTSYPPSTAFRNCLWPAGQDRVICGTYTSLVVAPLSAAAGGDVFKWDADKEFYQLLDWLPQP